MSNEDNMLEPRRRILMANGSEVSFPDELIGDFEGIKKLLGFPYGEIVRLPDYGTQGDWIMILDEEGKLKPNRVNIEGTRLFHNNAEDELFKAMQRTSPFMSGTIDLIVGNVAVVRQSDFSEDEDEPEDED